MDRTPFWCTDGAQNERERTEKVRRNQKQKTQVISRISRKSLSLITVWLQVRVLPGPPEIEDLRETRSRRPLRTAPETLCWTSHRSTATLNLPPNVREMIETDAGDGCLGRVPRTPINLRRQPPPSCASRSLRLSSPRSP